jgi:hypothetical protein
MTSPLPISNESMARAMLRRTLREAPEQQRKALSRASRRYAPTRQRRGPLFRAAVTYMDRCLEGRVLSRTVAGQGKSALASWVFWEVLGEPPRTVISRAALDGRHNRLVESVMVRVSQHALQRLFQRLRTAEASAALLELMPAASRAAQLYDQALANGERYAVHLRVPTGEGEAVLVWEDEGFLVKTWIHHDSMRERRSMQWGRALAHEDLLCA